MESAGLLPEEWNHLRRMADTIGAVFWLADAKQPGILYVSPAYSRIWGRDPQWLYAHYDEFFETIYPDDREQVRAATSRCIAQEQFEVDYRIIRPDGELRWIRDRGFLIRDPAGAPDRLAGFAEDVTASRQTASALRQSEAYLREVIANLPEGAAFIVDRNLRYLLADGEALRRVGMTPSDLVGKTIREALEPDLAAQYEPYYRQALNGEPYELEHFSHGRHYSSRGRPLVDDQGEIYAVLSISYDITERKQAEATLSESEARFRTLGEAIPLIVSLAQPNGQIEYINPYWTSFSGRSPEDFAAGDWLSAVHPDDQQMMLEEWQSALAAVRPYEYEFRARSIDGCYHWLLARGLPVYGADGTVVHWVNTALDIHDRKSAEDQQRHAAELNAFRVALSDTLRSLTDPIEIQAEACRLLGEQLGVDRAYYVEVNEAEGYARVDQNYLRGDSLSLVGTFRLAEYGWIVPYLQTGETIIVADVQTADIVPDSDRALMVAIKILAHISLPLMKAGALVGALCVTEPQPRQWSETEIELVGETADRIWAAIERARAEAELRESDAKYRMLFESIDEGFCIIEMIFDERNMPSDYRFVQTNEIFGQQTGLENATGKTALELVPDLERKWIEVYGQVALTGKSIRFEDDSAPMDRWFDVYASRIGEASSHQVAVVFKDITARKRREANLAFLAEIQADCAHLTTVDDMMQTIGAKIGAYLDLSICAFVDVDEAQDQASVQHSWHRADAPSLIGTYRISEFVTEAFYMAAQAGEVVVVNDTHQDMRTHAENFAALKVQAFIHVPFLRDGQWKFLFNAYDSRPRQWQEDQIELFCNLANQICPRLERARAEEATAADLRDTQLLRRLAARLVTEGDIQTLYQEIISAAIVLTHADAGSVQILDSATQELVLLATQGVSPTMIKRFHRIDASSDTSCGIALRNGERSFIDFDVPEREDPDGSMRIHVEAGLLSAQSTPLISRSGRAIGMVSTHWRQRYRPTERELRFIDLLARQAADLIEQRQFEQALRHSEAHFRMMIESAKEYAIFTLDLNGIVTGWNAGAERLLGYAEAEIVGRDGEIIFTPEDIERGAPDREKQLAKTQGRAENERWHLRQDGSRFWASGLVMPLQDEAGRMQGFVKILQDKTSERYNAAAREQLLQREQAARETAEQANRIKDEFLAVLSHELRSPLSPILGWVGLLRSGKLDAARTQQALGTIERNAKLQAELIEDLLDISRILSGKLSLTPSPVNLAVIIQAAIEVVQLAAETKSIQIVTALDLEVGAVAGDATRLQQVVWNLLSNAIKFTPAGGRVEVQLAQVGHQAHITVSDTGKGISPDFLPHVFDYFRQEDSATTRKFGGLGLGLAIVRHLVELHGGTIRVDSPGEELGATFTVCIPLMTIQPNLDQEAQSSAQSLTLRGIQVLVVDDDTDTRDYVAFLLEQAEATVIAADSAEAALSLLSRRPDILLSDVGMPEMNGYMLMQQIRALPGEEREIPAIALTAYAGDFNQKQALAAGFQRHFAKPVEPASLIRAILTLVGKG